MPDNEQRTIGEMSIDTRCLIERLEKVAVNETITYDELTALIGRDVKVKARHLLDTARNNMLKRRILFGCVQGVGIKREDSQGAISSAEQRTKNIRRSVKRAVTHVFCAEFEELSREDQNRMLATQSHLGALALALKPSSVKLVYDKVTSSAGLLPTVETLALFQK